MIFSSCSTTKKKEDQSKFKQFYHNTTSKYNAFFNADELMDRTIEEMENLETENYNKILPIYSYVEIDNPSSIVPQMDKAIDKAVTVAKIHENSNYIDDCYVLMGRAQYLKQDYASAEETFQYFQDEFDPKNPYGREYQKSKLKRKSSKDRKKEMKEKREEAQEVRKEAEKEAQDKRETAKKEREAEQKRRKKSKKNAKKRSKDRKKKVSEDKPSTPKKTKLTAEEKAAQAKAEAQQKEMEKYEKEKEKLKEEQEEMKRKENRPQGEGGIFKNRTSYYVGLFWLARTYIETKRFSAASYILDRLESTDPLADGVQSQLPAARAHLLIKSGESDAALLELEEAIAKESDKQLKARYAFIKAQLYEQANNEHLAHVEYKKAKDLSPDYEMKFNAELNEAKLSYKTGKISREKVESRLNKMFKEAKNDPYNDQIYFTMAQVKLEAGEIDGAIANFEQAVAVSSGNENVKLEGYYKLAELLYDQGYYREAKSNYDSALKLMSKNDLRYKECERLAKSLTDIAKHMEQLELQDSLIRLSYLSEGELRDIAIAALESQQEVADDADDGKNRISNVVPNNRRLSSQSRSNFFAYNTVALTQGKTEFSKTWGDRVLEDNWRRSLRADASSGLDALDIEEEEEKGYTDQDIKDYLREVPKSEAQKEVANSKIQTALFGLGIQFRERLRNYEKSIEVLERLIREYPKYNKRDEALYYLYLSYSDSGNMAGANEVKNKMLAEYPDSNFTKLVTDPAYAQSLMKSEDNIEAYYARTYKLFENAKYQAVLERVEEKSRLFDGKTDYDAKFTLLQAMAFGNIEGKQRYIKELDNVVKRYKGTDEAIRATEILRFLRGDAMAFDEILYEEEFQKFEVEDDISHYVFVVVYDQNKALQKIKINISDYNKKYHKSSKLNISNIVLNADSKSNVILVRPFKNKKEAMAYYDTVKKNQDKFITYKGDGEEIISYELMTATTRNYRELIKQRSIVSYREFFEKHYVK